MKKDGRAQTELQAIYPANSLQQGFIFHAQSHPADDAYRVQSLCDYYHEIDIGCYQKAWALAIKTYPILRTCFNWDETPIQIITKQGQLQFAFHDVTQELDKDATILRLQQADRAQAFDLTKPLLLRLHLMKQQENHYTLLKTEHHCIGDAWSAAVLLNQVHYYYSELVSGTTPLVIQDLAYLQAQAFIAKHQHEALSHWQSVVQGIHQANDVSALFTQRTNFDQLYTVDSPRELNIELNGGHYERIKSLTQDEGLTLHGVVQFAWHKLLHTYTQDAQTIVGTTISGRTLPITGIEKSVGLYINTLPLIVNWENTTTIKDQLHHIHKEIMGLNQYSFVYLSALQKGGRKLFHSLLLFENSSIALNKPASDAQLVASNRRGMQKLNYPLALTIHPQTNALRINFKYDGRCLTDERAQALLNQVVLILQQIPCRLHASHNTLNLLTPDEHSFIINTLNDTNAPFPEDKTLQAMFAEQVARTPDATALVFEGVRLTYAELNKEANQLAQWLHAQGIESNALIVLCMERSLELLIGILGVLKAGCAYVPVDPHFPLDRIRYVLDDTNSRFVLTLSHHMDSLKEGQNDTVQWIALDKRPWRDAPETPLPIPCSSADLAYVIYTSGTTGRPKGVAITHKGAVNRLHWMQNTYPLDEHDVVLQKTPYVFDVSVWELLWAHWAGAKIVMARPEGHKDASYLHQLIREEGITVLHFVPSMLSAFTQALSILETRVPASVRYVFCSGEALLPSQVQAFYSLCEDRLALHNLYGPTEASIDVTAFACPRGAEAIYIGRPIQNTRAYVLNAELKPVPMGAPGDLYLGGAGLLSCYWNKPELTQAALIDNPFASEDDRLKGYVRLYKTGDLARWLPDGNLDYIGRSDFQVKVRGFRIELGEIEQVMLNHPHVQQAVALVKEQITAERSHRFISAFYVGRAERETLRQHLAQLLPDYMVPSQCIKLASFPVTSNGKLDRNALIAPSLNVADAIRHTAPRTELERTLCNIWQTALRLPSVGITDNFFELGGDSIESLRLVAMMQRAGFHVSVSDIFTHKTILQLIEHTNHALKPDVLTYTPYSLIDEATRARLQKDSIEDIYPAGFLQMGMLVESLKSDAKGTYHDVFAYTINRPLDESLLLSIFQELTLKHPLLRTAFVEHTDYGFVCIQEASIDMARHYGGIALQQIASFIATEKNQPLSFEEPGLFRVFVLNPTATQFVLVFSFHHAITDGWSVASLMAEFTAAFVDGQTIATETIPPYPRVIQRERIALASESLQTFWQEYLQDAPPAVPHMVFNPDALIEEPILETGHLLEDKTATAILSHAKQSGLSPDMIFVAAYLNTLSRFCQQQELIIGLVMNNRLEEAGGDKLFGLHLNTLPLRIMVTGDRLLSRIAEQRARLDAYKAYPYGKIRSSLTPGSDLYTCAFNYIHFHVFENHVQSQALRATHVFEKTNVPLTLHVSRQQDNFRLTLKALNHFIDEDTANLLLASIQYDLALLVDLSPRMTLSLPENQSAIIQSWAAKPAPKPEARDYVAPRTESEQRLCQIWQTVLCVPSVGITDNFFELGGDSIESIRLVALMQREGFHVSVSDIFTHKTILQLIKNTNHALKRDIPTYIPFSLIDEATRAHLLKDSIEDIYPAGFLQMGMLVESLKNNAEGTYHDVFAYTINRPFDEKLLLSIFQELTLKHPLLRTAFVEHADYGYVCIQAASIDIRRHYGGTVEQQVATFIATEKNLSLPFEEPGLFRIIVLNPTATQFALVFSFHHAITDGWSVASMMAEFTAAYADGQAITRDAIPPYQRVIKVEREALASASQQLFWREYLHNAPPAAPHMVFNADALIKEPLLETSRLLDDKTASAILTHAKQSGLSPDVIFLAAYLNTLSRLCKQQDLVVGLVMNNRLEEAGGDKLFGLHLNTLPLRIKVTAEGFLAQLAEQRARLDAYKAYPYGKIRSTLTSGSDVYTCAFNYIHFHVIDTHGQSLRTAQVFEKTNVPLTLHVARQQVSFRIAIKAANYFIDEDTANLVLTSLQYDLALLINLTPKVALNLPDNQDAIIHSWAAMPAPKPEAREFVAPRTELEHRLCQIWRTVLRLPSVGIIDNFFELGGDSIESIRLVAMMQREGFHVSVSDLFTHKTILQLIENTNHMAKRDIPTYTPYSLIDGATRAHLQTGTVEDIYPAGFLQMGMLVESLKNNTEGTYHDVFAYAINRPFDENLLLSIFQKLTLKHPLLRTAFVEHADYGYVCIQAANIDIRRHFGGTIEQQVATFIATEKNLSLPFEEPGLFRVIVLNPTATQFVLVFSFHHAITDGWSVASMMAEFTAAYADGKTVTREVIPPYQRVIQAEREALTSESLQTFWQEYLQDAPPAIPHLVFNADALIEENLLETGFLLDKKTTSFVLTHAKQSGVSPDLIFLAAYLKTLARLCQRQDMVVGLVMNNRLEEAGGDKVFGLHLNTLPLRIEVSEENLLHRLLEQRARLDAYKAYPYGKIRSELTPGSEVYTCAFNYIHFHVIDSPVPSQALQSTQVFEKTNIPLTLHVARSKESFRLTIKAASYFIDEDTAKLLLASIQYDLALLLNLSPKMAFSLPENQNTIIQSWAAFQQLKPVTREFVAPRTEIEHTLCRIWQTVLRAPSVGINDNFFELGGDSIESIRLVAMMQREGFHVSVSDIFTHKTISTLIEHTHHALKRDIPTYTPYSLIDEATRARLQKDSIEDIYPAGFLQMGMLVESLKNNAEDTYHDVFAYTINRPFDENLLLSIFQKLTLKHPLLRTAFIEHADYGYVCIQEASIDIARHYGGIVKQQVAAFIATEKNQPLPFEEPGLFRLIVLNPTNAQFMLVFSFHHAITDGWSVASLMAELTATYVDGHAIAIDTIPPYQRVIQAEREAMVSESLQTFWREYLQDTPPAVPHLMFNAKAISDSPLLEISTLLDEKNSNLVLAHAKHEGISPDLLFLAAWLNTLSRLCKREDMTIGLVMNNRLEESGGDKLFGLHLNTLPLRIKVSEDHFLSRLAEQRARLDRYKAYPYGKIRADLGADSYTCAFNYIHFHVVDAHTSSLRTLQVFEKTNIPLTLHVARQQSTFRIAIKAANHFIDTDTANLILNSIQYDLALLIHSTPKMKLRLPDNQNDVIQSWAALQKPEKVPHEFVAPRTELERTLCDIWQTALQVRKIEISDNFFELGGDSIESIRLVAMMQQKGFHVSVADIFTHKTILQLIEQTNHTTSRDSITYIPYSLIDNATRARLQTNTVEDIYPAGSLQIAMLVESLKEDAQGTYHDVFAYTINRPLNEERLVSIFQDLTIKHPLLRTAFVEHADYGYVCTQEAHTDMTRHYDGIVEEQLDTFIATEINKALPLEVPGLFRVIVLNPTSTQFVLVFSFHHAITDGWSVATMMAEFTAAYAQTQAIAMETMPPYQRVIQAEREALASSSLQTFWRDYLQDAPPVVPHLVFNPRALVESPHLETASLLEEKTTYAVLATAKRLGVAPDLVFLAAYLNALSHLSKQQDMIIGLFMNNRLEETGGDKIFGLHLNILPLRMEMKPFYVDDNDALILALAEERSRLLPFKAYPYPKICVDLDKPAGVYTSAFNYTHFHISEQHGESGVLQPVYAFEKMSIPLTLQVSRYLDKFRLVIRASRHFIDKETANHLIDLIKKSC
jgi:amino acid adenylation domain-containing protein